MEKKIKWVKKRDGRIVPFEKGKITEAIFKAAKSVGGENRYLAEDLAEAVTLYLEKNFEGKIPSVEEIQDIVERVLIKTGHAKTAKAYILYRQKRANVRKVREGIKPEELIEREKERINLIRDIKISVKRSDDVLTEWNKERIIEALLRETGISRNIAEIIVSEVEEEVITSKLKVLTSSIIRELVNAKLIQYGFEEERRKHARLGIPFYDVSLFFKNFSGSPDELSMKFGKHIKKEYALSEVFADDVVLSYFTGEIFIHCLEEIDKFYSIQIHSELEKEEMDILDKYCCFVNLKIDNKIGERKGNFFEVPLPDGFEFIYKIAEGKDIEIELNKEKDIENLTVQKITINTEKVENSEKLFEIIKKVFEEKEKFLDCILKEEVKMVFKKFKKRFEIEITGEKEDFLKELISLNTFKINVKIEPQKFPEYLDFLKYGNVSIRGKFNKEKIYLLKDIGEKITARISI